MNVAEIKELIQVLDESSLREMHYTSEGISLFLSKNKHSSNNRTQSVEVVSTEVDVLSEPTLPVTEVKDEVPQAGIIVRSPIVGVVYLSPSPEEDAYTKVGSEVTSGQVLCLVEAMKIMNEIKADTSGKIVEILVENEQVVEYNQPLFRIV